MYLCPFVDLPFFLPSIPCLVSHVSYNGAFTRFCFLACYPGAPVLLDLDLDLVSALSCLLNTVPYFSIHIRYAVLRLVLFGIAVQFTGYAIYSY
jgi:hypothetical protein